MQRNMLLAITLTIVIVLVWQKYLMPPPPAPEQVAEQAIGQAIPADGQATPTDRPTDRFPDQAAPIPGREPIPEPVSLDLSEASEIVIENEHIAATFTTHGGRLVSLRLTEYESKLGGPAEIVLPTEEDKRPLALTFIDSRFGMTSENFIYEYAEYNPTDTAVIELAEGLRSSAGAVFPQAEAAEIERQLDASLPKTDGAESLRAATIAVAARSVAAADSVDPLSARADALESGKSVVFSRQLTSRIKIIKAFTLPVGSYSFDMHTVIVNTGADRLDLGRGGPSYSISWAPGMDSAERIPQQDELQTVYLEQGKFDQEKVSGFTPVGEKEGIFGGLMVSIGMREKNRNSLKFSENLSWIGLKRKYFFVLLEPVSGLAGASLEALKVKNVEKAELDIRLDMPPISLAPGEMSADTVRVSAGPMLVEVLESLGPDFEQIFNFGFFDFFGKILLSGLLWFNKYVQNYGLAIILLTVVVRVGLFPLNQKSYKSMKEMQAVQPLVAELREKYKNNPQEMNKKMMELYREHKVNPLGGCLPMVFQMPIFIALFQALRNAVELRGAQFLWMADLSEPDRLFMITSSLPLNLLPLLVIVAMLVQQKMTPMAGGGQNEAQQKMMQFMPIFFGFIFYSMPAGLTVYFLVTTVLGLVQQYFVQKAA
jgi:YidC/Oxa1 family membrane protein insertase